MGKINNKKQTAIEWYITQMELLSAHANSDTIDIIALKSNIEIIAKQMEKEQSNDKINTAIKKFEHLKSKANSLTDVMYLDGVLAVLYSIKNETYGGQDE
jgi:hypothetical protein